jgi:hypothetical protein
LARAIQKRVSQLTDRFTVAVGDLLHALKDAPVTRAPSPDQIRYIAPIAQFISMQETVPLREYDAQERQAMDLAYAVLVWCFDAGNPDLQAAVVAAKSDYQGAPTVVGAPK